MNSKGRGNPRPVRKVFNSDEQGSLKGLDSREGATGPPESILDGGRKGCQREHPRIDAAHGLTPEHAHSQAPPAGWPLRWNLRKGSGRKLVMWKCAVRP